MAKARGALSNEEVDALHAKIYGGENPDGEQTAEAAEGEATGEVQEATGQETFAGGGTAPATNEASGGYEGAGEAPKKQRTDWKQKYQSLEGKFNAEVPQLQQELRNTQQMLAKLAESSEPLPFDSENAGLTAEEIDEYGPDLIDVVKRAARSEFAPVVEQLQKDKQQLQEQLQTTSKNIADSSRTTMMADLDRQVPDWKALNKEPAFLDWLAQPDLLSGVPRQQLLTNAFERSDSNRVIAFFVGFKMEQTGQPAPSPASGEAQPTPKPSGLETLLAPGRPAGTAATGAQQSGKIWTQAEIAAITRQKISGKLSQNDADRFDADIFAAAQEGRIR